MSEIIAKTRYAQSSPRKLRAVALLVKRQPANKSLTILQFTPKKAARLLAKTIKTAIYNAVNNFNLDKDKLTIKNILIDQGPTLTRFIAMARGSGNEYKKRTAHITVILETPELAVAKKAVDLIEEEVTVKSKSGKNKPKKPAKKTAAKKPAKLKGNKTTVSVKSRKAKSK